MGGFYTVLYILHVLILLTMFPVLYSEQSENWNTVHYQALSIHHKITHTVL